MDSTQKRKRLRQAAWLAIIVHFIAGLCMYFVLGNGLETNPNVADRMKFISEHRVAWTLAWVSWNCAALAILNFFVAFASFHSENADYKVLLRLVVLITCAGVLFDLSAEAMEMFWLPQAPGVSFLDIERKAVLLTGVWANSFYTAATFLSALCTKREYPLWIFLSALAVVISGTAITIGAILDSIPILFWSNALMIPAIVTWQLGIALTREKFSDA